jgi:hypothetical protein
MAKARKEHPKPKSRKSVKKTSRRIEKNNEMLRNIWEKMREQHK